MLLTPNRTALLLVFLFVIEAPTVFAQKNFIDGYVVTPGKDTLKGQIDFRDWDTSPDHIFFRQGDAGKEYGPADLKAFGVGGQRYESHTVHISPWSREPENLSSEQDLGSPYDTTIFLQVLTSGKLTLWEDRASGGTNYYFTDGRDGKPEQLRVITKVETVGGTTKVGQVSAFRNQLVALMSDCEALTGRIRSSEYNGKSLERLFFAYNNCGKDTSEKRADHGRAQLFPMAGFVSSSLSFSGADVTAGEHFKTSSSVVLGAGALFILPRNRQQLSFVADITWQHFSSTSDSVAESTYITEAGHIDYSLLKLDVLFRYRYPTEGIRPFVEGGMGNAAALGLNAYQGATDRIGNTNDTEPMIGGAWRKHFESWIVGAGVGGKRWTVEGRYESSTGISGATAAGSAVKSWYVLVSFAL